MKKKWTNQEVLLLKELYPKKINKDIAKILQRTNYSVTRKSNDLKLRKDKNWLYNLKRENLIKAPRFKGIKNHRWNPNKTWYRSILVKEHPFCDVGGRVLEHRLVMEQWMRTHFWWHPALININGILYLSKRYIVHHKNEILNDNRICNLEVLKQKSHMKDHMFKIMKHRVCEWCNISFPVGRNRYTRRFCSNHCSNKYTHKIKGHIIT